MSHHLLSDLFDTGKFSVFLGVLAAGLVLGGLFLGFIQLRSRYPEDDQIGLKALFQFFQSLGVLLVVSGLAVGSMEFWNNGLEIDSFTATLRTGVALILAGLVFGGVHGLMLRYGVTKASLGGVRRYYLGWRLAVHGFVLLGCVLLLAAMFLMRDPRRYEVRAELRQDQVNCFATLVVWGLSWLVHVALYWRPTASPVPTGPTWESKE